MYLHSPMLYWFSPLWKTGIHSYNRLRNQCMKKLMLCLVSALLCSPCISECMHEKAQAQKTLSHVCHSTSSCSRTSKLLVKTIMVLMLAPFITSSATYSLIVAGGPTPPTMPSLPDYNSDIYAIQRQQDANQMLENWNRELKNRIRKRYDSTTCKSVYDTSIR